MSDEVSGQRLRGQQHAPRAVDAGATVTVVIPCYNYERFIEGAIRSALDQPGVAVDVVVVDDRSPDDSAAVAERVAASDPRVRVLRNERNSGPVPTFNRGLAEARGEFVVRLDADDLLTPGSLGRAVALLQAFPEVGLVYGHPLHFEDGTALPPARETATGWTVWEGHDWLTARCAAGNNAITSPEVVMRSSVVDRVGGQRDLTHAHDMEMWLRIAAFSDVGYVQGADQAWHRDHPASYSMTAEEPIVILGEIRNAFTTLCGYLREQGDAAADHLEQIALRAVAGQALAYARRDVDRGRVSDEAAELAAFAVSCYPRIGDTPEGMRYRRAVARARRLPRSVVAAVGTFPRLGRRLRERTQSRRWHATGVYERLATGGGSTR